jgi:hypothetical protein
LSGVPLSSNLTSIFFLSVDGPTLSQHRLLVNYYYPWTLVHFWAGPPCLKLEACSLCVIFIFLIGPLPRPCGLLERFDCALD